MNTYATTVTVEGRGEVRVAGVPFAAGTEVEITISLKPRTTGEITASEDEAWAAARDRMREVLKTAKGFRNSPRIPREELYVRGEP